MKVLLDECVDPKAATFFSTEFEVRHVTDLGWLGVKNGELVKLAEDDFDVLLTIDGNMRHQTSLKNLSLCVVVAEGHFRSTEDYREPIRRFEVEGMLLAKGEFHVLSERV